MKRLATRQLEEWMESSLRKPLILHGARQVGKTWLMKDFGSKHFDNMLYVDFTIDKNARILFEDDLNIEMILQMLSLDKGVKIEEGKTLIVLDEIQEIPRAITALKYFYEEYPNLHIIASASLIGVTSRNTDSFPVGKVDFLTLYPMTFVEFVSEVKGTKFGELLNKSDYKQVTLLKNHYIEALRLYYVIGGMPEAVQVYIDTGDVEKSRDKIKNIVAGYESDFSKYASGNTITRIRMLWHAIPGQLAKENKKFIYGQVKSGARAKDYEAALLWLKDAGLIHMVYRTSKPEQPLKGFEDLSAFKIFVLDVGVLSYLAGIEPSLLLNKNNTLKQYKGVITEQYVFQQLLSLKDVHISYWSSNTGSSELDFLISCGQKLIPIEVKAEENLKSKSLRAFCQKFGVDKAYRISMSDYRNDGWLENIPLYSFSKFLQSVSNEKTSYYFRNSKTSRPHSSRDVFFLNGLELGLFCALLPAHKRRLL